MLAGPPAELNGICFWVDMYRILYERLKYFIFTPHKVISRIQWRTAAFVNVLMSAYFLLTIFCHSILSSHLKPVNSTFFLLQNITHFRGLNNLNFRLIKKLSKCFTDLRSNLFPHKQARLFAWVLCRCLMETGLYQRVVDGFVYLLCRVYARLPFKGGVWLVPHCPWICSVGKEQIKGPHGPRRGDHSKIIYIVRCWKHP